MSLVQNHPPDLTTSPGCSFPPTPVAVKPSIILPHPLLPSPLRGGKHMWLCKCTYYTFSAVGIKVPFSNKMSF